MKEPLCLLVLLIGMMTGAFAQECRFISQDGYEVQYDAKYLAEVIAASDTMVDDELLMEEYESIFPSQRGSHEPAILVLLPDDYDFYVIVIQENKRGRLLALRILTRDGWSEADRLSLKNLKNYF